LVGKPEIKKQLGRPRFRRLNNTKMNLKELVWDDMDWIDPAQDRDQWKVLVKVVMKLRTQKMLGSSSVAAQLVAYR
jgi:hypothetical protein